MSSTPDVQRPDGRTARRDRNRLAVLDAMIELFSEDVDPGPEAVAERSGVSPRSVYRYFEDRDELLRAAIDRQLELTYPLQLIHQIGRGSLEERIDRFVNARLRLYEAVASSARTARVRGRVNPTVAEMVSLTHRGLREQVVLQFAPELELLDARDQRSVLSTVDALTQFETLDLYRIVQGLSTSMVRTVLVDALRALFDPATTSDTE